MGGGMWGIGFLWPLVWLLVISLVAIGAIYLVTRRTGSGESNQAMEILREQYARGEISDEEFDERASKLSSRSS